MNTTCVCIASVLAIMKVFAWTRSLEGPRAKRWLMLEEECLDAEIPKEGQARGEEMGVAPTC